MDYKKLLDDYTALVDRKLESYFEELLEEAERYHPFMHDVYGECMKYVLRKGKRLASCSTIITYRGYGDSIDDKILNVCIAVEIYRHSILIHDDLIDRDDLRRGGKAFHRLLIEARDARFGEGLAVFTGNMMHALSLQALRNSGFNQKQVDKVLDLFIDDFRQVNESQVLDLLFEYKEPSIEEWYVMAGKRASSLFKTTILTGAIFGGASEEDLKLLGEAARHIGYSFDITDDIIGTFATEEQYGRPIGGDIALGKKPLHVVYAFQSADEKGLKALKELFESKEINTKKIEALKKIIRETGALEKAKGKSREHADKALKLINKTGMSAETKDFFQGFVEYVSESLDWYA
jgi:geranylgeranyl pyrophosphate synthase